MVGFWLTNKIKAFYFSVPFTLVKARSLSHAATTRLTSPRDLYKSRPDAVGKETVLSRPSSVSRSPPGSLLGAVPGKSRLQMQPLAQTCPVQTADLIWEERQASGQSSRSRRTAPEAMAVPSPADQSLLLKPVMAQARPLLSRVSTVSIQSPASLPRAPRALVGSGLSGWTRISFRIRATGADWVSGRQECPSHPS